MVILDIAQAYADDRKEILQERALEDKLMLKERQDQIIEELKLLGIEATKVEMIKAKGKSKNMRVEVTVAMPRDAYAYEIKISKTEVICFAFPKMGKQCKYTLEEVFAHGEEAVKKIKESMGVK